MHPKINVLTATSNAFGGYASFEFGRYRHTGDDALDDWIWRSYRSADISDASIKRFRCAQDKQMIKIKNDHIGVQ